MRYSTTACSWCEHVVVVHVRESTVSWDGSDIYDSLGFDAITPQDVALVTAHHSVCE